MVPLLHKAATAVIALSYASGIVSAQDPAIATTGLRPLTYSGCYSSSKPLSDQGAWTYQSPGYCQGLCVKLQKPVMATTGGSNCFCGDQLPLASSKTLDSKCNTPCFGYDKDHCGGQGFWSVQLTGLNNAVTNIKPSAGAASASASASPSKASPSPKPAASSKSKAVPSPDRSQNAPPSVITRASTVVVTAPGQTNAAAPVTTTNASKGPNKAAIVAGVVVGVTVLSAVAGAMFFCLRHRRQKAKDEEYRQNTENPFNNNHVSSSAASMSDSRLEPSVMMQRRQSDGSIADNQDYSRRILKVTNPDGRL